MKDWGKGFLADRTACAKAQGEGGLGTPRELGGGRTERGVVSPGAGNGVREQRVQD